MTPTTLTPARYFKLWAAWLALAAGIFLLCFMLSPGPFGTHGITFGWPAPEAQELRLQRVAAAGLVGMALAAAGVVLQALLRNPLAEPYVLGISSGSAVGVLAWLMLTGPLYFKLMNWPHVTALLNMGRALPAVAGALVTCLIVFAIARRRWSAGGAIEPITLLLVGVVISAINAAILMLVNALAENGKGFKVDIANYMMGSISEGELNRTLLLAAAAVFLVAYLPVLAAGAALNVGSLSDLEATSLGINIRRLRSLSFISASTMTGTALMLAGPIGFVGLICPHICRRLVGADHRKLLVAAPLCGAAFLMAADTAVRLLLNILGTELPVGVITALCGGPFFLFLLRRRESGLLTGGGL